MRMRAGGVVLVLALSACNTVAPIPLRGGEVCFRCRRAIVDTRLAAQTVGIMASNFRTAGCLAKYLADHPADTSAIFVTDYESGRFMPAASGVYVPTVDRNNGERDFVVYRNGAAASTEAAARQTSTLSWAQVLEQAKSAPRGI